MTDKCPSCDHDLAELDTWAEIANEADMAVSEIGHRMFMDRARWDIEPQDFLEALIAGMLTGVVATGCCITLPESRDEFMQMARDYLETARANFEASDGAGEAGSALQ